MKFLIYAMKNKASNTIQLLYKWFLDKQIMSHCLDRLSTDPEQFLGLSHDAVGGVG